MGPASVARFNGGLITFKTVHKKAYQVKATSYRQLRVMRDQGGTRHERRRIFACTSTSPMNSDERR